MVWIPLLLKETKSLVNEGPQKTNKQTIIYVVTVENCGNHIQMEK